MIEPTPGVWVADVVWAEIHEEVMQKRRLDLNTISNIQHIDSARSSSIDTNRL